MDDLTEHRGSVQLEDFAMPLPSTVLSTQPSGRRILVVEDQNGLREILREVLSCESYAVDALGSLAEAPSAAMKRCCWT
jgi:hypothetical protein